MQINSSFITTPKYFNMLISATGQLSGNERLIRIKRIGQYNPWLAAKCINTCVNEETEIEDWLILRCVSLYRKFGDLQSLAALFELQEYAIICDVLDINVKNNGKSSIQWMSNIQWISFLDYNIPDAFAEISYKISLDLAVRIFKRLIELGYVMNVNAYNSIIARTNELEEREDLIQEMESYGVDTDAQTYYHMIMSSKSFIDAYGYLDSFKKKSDYLCNQEQYLDVYSKIINLANNIPDTRSIFNDFLNYSPDLNTSYKVIASYYCKLIDFCETKAVADLIFEDFKKTYIILYGKINKSGRRKKLMQYFNRVINSYLKFNSKNIHDSSVFRTLFVEIIDEFRGKYKKLSLSSTIIERCKKYHNFEECKILVQILINNNCNIDKEVYKEMFNYIQNWEDIYYIFSKISPNDIDPRQITNSTRIINENEVEQMIGLLIKSNFNFNIYLYNAFIKKASFDNAFKIIDNMSHEGIHPDAYSLNPLLRKWKSIEDFIRVIEFANNHNITADKRMIETIVKRVEFLRIQDQFFESFYILNNKNASLLNSVWKEAIADVIKQIQHPEP